MQSNHEKCWAGWSTSWNQDSGRNSDNLRYADDITLMAESEEELKSFLMKVKEEREKAGLKLNIQKAKIMGSSPITSWQIHGETEERAADFILGDSKIISQQWPQDWKRSVFIPIPKKGNAKECSNYCKIALISHTSKVMLKILQDRLQQYMNHELPDVQAGFWKGRGTRD